MTINRLNMMDKMNEVCTGCSVYERYRVAPSISMLCVGYIIKDFKCPCKHCLIKMMCKVSCDKLEGRKWPKYNEAINLNIVKL